MKFLKAFIYILNTFWVAIGLWAIVSYIEELCYLNILEYNFWRVFLEITAK